MEFKQLMRKEMLRSVNDHFGKLLQPETLTTLSRELYSAFIKRLEDTSSMDTEPRIKDVVKHCIGILVEFMEASQAAENGLTGISAWRRELEAVAINGYRDVHNRWSEGSRSLQRAEEMMSSTSRLYKAVRQDIGVSMRRGDVAEGRYGKSIGSQVSLIAEGFKNGTIMDAAMQSLQ